MQDAGSSNKTFVMMFSKVEGGKQVSEALVKAKRDSDHEGKIEILENKVNHLDCAASAIDQTKAMFESISHKKRQHHVVGDNSLDYRRDS
jgi:uncharacterized protein YhfF